MAAPAGNGLPVLLTVAEVAQSLRTSPKVVYEMIRLGRLPGVTRIGRRVLLRRDRLLEWLAASTEGEPRGRRATDQEA